MSTLPQIQAKLKLHPDVQSLEEEWSGITNPVVRRKLQNRLNQRAARRRKAAQQTATAHSSSSSNARLSQHVTDRTAQHHPATDIEDALALKVDQSGSSNDYGWAVQPFRNAQSSTFASLRKNNTCMREYNFVLEQRALEMKELVEQMQTDHDSSSYWLYPLPSDHLISLVYYNVYRALICNIAMLGLDLNLMYMDEYPSPFLPLSQSANSNIRRLPPALQPTELQKTMAHHPQWDIIPDPDVRDNILRSGVHDVDDSELCADMVGEGTYDHDDLVDTQNKNGVIVWGEPWDISGWEVTEAFVRKWPFVLRNAPRIQNSTNRWREYRGEEPLDFDRILGAAS